MSKLLFDGVDWDAETIDRIWKTVDKIAKEEYGLDYYEPRIEIITADQMLDICSTHGLPNMYEHWTHGKNYLYSRENYEKVGGGLAYEIVINSNPSIAYCMENNSALMQTLVIAHASCGHSSFFKNNYMFTQNTEADYILDYLKFSRKYIEECEKEYGASSVERTLDAAQSLSWYGIDTYKKKRNKSKKDIQKQYEDRVAYFEKSRHYDDYRFRSRLNILDDRFRLMELKELMSHPDKVKDNIAVHDDNVLYFIEKTSSVLTPWQKEIVRIVRKIQQYFYPQMCTKVMNEGWACFWHYELLNNLYKKGHINNGHYLEFLHSHTGVVNEINPFSFHGFNPYYVGFHMFMDLRRICENPTDEDKEWFPSIVNTDWNKTLHYIMRSFNDSSFIEQWLSPKLIRDFRLALAEEVEEPDGIHHPSLKWFKCTDVPDGDGYRAIRKRLADCANFRYLFPEVEVEYYTNGKQDQRTMHLTVHKNIVGQSVTPESVAWMQEPLEFLWGNSVIDLER